MKSFKKQIEECNKLKIRQYLFYGGFFKCIKNGCTCSSKNCPMRVKTSNN